MGFSLKLNLTIDITEKFDFSLRNFLNDFAALSRQLLLVCL